VLASIGPYPPRVNWEERTPFIESTKLGRADSLMLMSKSSARVEIDLRFEHAGHVFRGRMEQRGGLPSRDE
jgi:hypothetical protein